ncbi:hypothetical protein HK102_005429 [Quaeritorhiza haematococci]|nr:hypothetical protein HK102_005429 [Quaeritorhiza haematococci]
MMVYSLLNRWGITGFLTHVDEVANFYLEKRDAFLKAADKHLQGVAEWTVPSAGMFVWLKLLGVDDAAALISTKAKEKKVLLVPGFEFFPNPRATPYVRAAYSTATPQEMDEALQRLRELVLEAQTKA